jgi:hypothetical protein
MQAFGKSNRLAATWLPAIGVMCLLMSSSSTARISAHAGSNTYSKRVGYVGRSWTDLSSSDRRIKAFLPSLIYL